MPGYLVTSLKRSAHPQLFVDGISVRGSIFLNNNFRPVDPDDLLFRAKLIPFEIIQRATCACTLRSYFNLGWRVVRNREGEVRRVRWEGRKGERRCERERERKIGVFILLINRGVRARVHARGYIRRIDPILIKFLAVVTMPVARRSLYAHTFPYISSGRRGKKREKMKEKKRGKEGGEKDPLASRS